MAAKSQPEESSERKRLSIPKVDASTLEWWNVQHDPGLSVRMLIRAEIERNGLSDVVYRPVTQQPRRGRPPGQNDDTSAATEIESPAGESPVPTTDPVPEPTPIRRPEVVGASGMSAIDALMNG